MRGAEEMSRRNARLERVTNETRIDLNLHLDGQRQIEVRTGLGFLDHMIRTLAFHAGWDLQLDCRGDLEVDDHHTVEDCALLLGSAIDGCLGERHGIVRFGLAFAPLDEALARVVVDLSGRPAPIVDLGLRYERLGDVATENLTHFFTSLAVTMRAALHVDVLRGDNDHHRAEAAFKATALALRAALAPDRESGVPSTKGVLT
jgi:imidazoleglycerol phosphate dehydratase HisB